ncbi:MAG: dephospho-CoA kinase [Alistipes sp.]|nr:dephospho-CoA kinase [Alistipes sp.]
MIRVGVCGGIGSGKSTVCEMFAERGVAIYSSDERAKELMNTSPQIREALQEAFGRECYTAEGLNRRYLAEQVFGDEARLQQLNAIVHPAVREDFERWAAEQSGEYVILESAILFESHFDRIVDVSVAVLAPESLRLNRAMQRDGATAEQIKARMAMQCSDDFLLAHATYSIVNISLEDVRKDVDELNFRLRTLSKNRAQG